MKLLINGESGDTVYVGPNAKVKDIILNICSMTADFFFRSNQRLCVDSVENALFLSLSYNRK